MRDGGDRWGAGEFAAKIAGEYGICYRTPCFPIYKRGHYGSFIGRGYETLDEFRALVREVKERGGHFIKIMNTGLKDFTPNGELTATPHPAPAHPPSTPRRGAGRTPAAAGTPRRAHPPAAVAKAAALGAYLAPGSDAGAWAVPHGKGGLDEQHWLREALGSDADAVLERGAAEIRKRF